MDKELIFNNIKGYIDSGYYNNLYFELSEYVEDIRELEDISAKLFNAIVIACQLFDDRERQESFINLFSRGLDSFYLEHVLSDFNITEEEAKERLMYGYGMHFTTPNICNLIKQEGVLKKFGNNGLITEEENEIINKARDMQIANDPTAEEQMRYLYKGFGLGVSSYSSQTNGFWMHRTPESLTFLFGNISERNKEKSMQFVANNISALDEESKRITFDTMSKIYDRLIGEEQTIGCILIDRDLFEYEVDYYYGSGEPVAKERRPYRNSLCSLEDNDNKITNDLDASKLKYLVLPTIKQLEMIRNNNKQY